MKTILSLLLPMLLLCACNGSDSNPIADTVPRSTFDALQAELDKAQADKEALTKKNAELASTAQNLSTDNASYEVRIEALNKQIAGFNAALANTTSTDESEAIKAQRDAAILERDKLAARLVAVCSQ